jgi:hypothetical protein
MVEPRRNRNHVVYARHDPRSRHRVFGASYSSVGKKDTIVEPDLNVTYPGRHREVLHVKVSRINVQYPIAAARQKRTIPRRNLQDTAHIQSAASHRKMALSTTCSKIINVASHTPHIMIPVDTATDVTGMRELLNIAKPFHPSREAKFFDGCAFVGEVVYGACSPTIDIPIRQHGTSGATIRIDLTYGCLEPLDPS